LGHQAGRDPEDGSAHALDIVMFEGVEEVKRSILTWIDMLKLLCASALPGLFIPALPRCIARGG
jgi:hypothetical protein